MKQMLLLAIAPFFLVGMPNEDCYNTAKSLIKAQPSDKKDQINGKYLADAMFRTAKRNSSDVKLIQKLHNTNQISDSSTLLLHTVNQLLLEADQRDRVHAMQMRKQKDRHEHAIKNYKVKQVCFLFLSSIISAVLGLVLSGSC